MNDMQQNNLLAQQSLNGSTSNSSIAGQFVQAHYNWIARSGIAAGYEEDEGPCGEVTITPGKKIDKRILLTPVK